MEDSRAYLKTGYTYVYLGIEIITVLFNSFPWFDGNSTTYPISSVQRIYFSGRFKENSHLMSIKPYSSLIRGASFVASTCHRGRGTTNREDVRLYLLITAAKAQHIFRVDGIYQVVAILEKIIRVDSLGKCHHTPTGNNILFVYDI